LWQYILDQLKNLPSNKTLLKALDELFAAGLNSTHREIINLTASFWNTTFGQLDSLEYPDMVEQAMRRLRPLVELDLPTFPETTDASVSQIQTYSLNHTDISSHYRHYMT
jgi:deoxyribodipyrimidine photolyase-like uncharacterized protein